MCITITQLCITTVIILLKALQHLALQTAKQFIHLARILLSDMAFVLL